jgi:hypothetical protein
MEESFNSKVKRSLGHVQMWTPSLIAYVESFKILNQMWNIMGKNFRLIILCDHGNHVY